MSVTDELNQQVCCTSVCMCVCACVCASVCECVCVTEVRVDSVTILEQELKQAK